MRLKIKGFEATKSYLLQKLVARSLLIPSFDILQSN